MNIPGFHYDETRKKYFKITPNSTLPHKYNSDSIKREERENERSIKRAKFGNRQLSNSQNFRLNSYSNLDLKLNELNINQRKVQFDQYLLQNIQKTYCSTTRGGYHFDKIHKIVFDDLNDCFFMSSNKSIYEIKSNDITGSNENKYSYNQVVPILKTTRNDKKHSILRSFQIYKQNNVPTTIRTWQGIQDEHSEVEIFTKIDQITYKSRSIKTSNNESFNTSIYNKLNNNLIICGSKHCFKQSFSNLNKKDEVILQGTNVVSADYKTANVYLFGTRNGDALIVDDRVNNKDIYKNKRQNKTVKGSIINIKSLTGNRVLSSRIGSSIKLFDIRMGFKHFLLDYDSAKFTQDVFGEQLEMINDTHFLAQTKSTCEIFDINYPYPVNSLNFSNDDRSFKLQNNVIESCVFTKKNQKGILLTNGEDFDIYY